MANSFLQTGKSLLLNEVLPALIAADELFGVGRAAEARVFRLSTDKFDRANGEKGFLSSLLDELTAQANAMGISEVERVRRQLGDVGVIARLTAFVNFLPHDVQHFILVDEVQNFFLLTKPDGSLDSSSIDQMRRYARVCLPRTFALTHLPNRIFKSLVGSSPIHCAWVLTGSSMATYWVNLALAPVNDFSILDHLLSVHVPTRVEAGALVDSDGMAVAQVNASFLIVDYMKLLRFCGFGESLSRMVPKNDNSFFKGTPSFVVAFLSEGCNNLEPSFWKSDDPAHWFNITFWDPFHRAARIDLEASTYEPWQYLHWYFRLWRNSVEHKKRESVAASFAHMRTMPQGMLRLFNQLEGVMRTLNNH